MLKWSSWGEKVKLTNDAGDDVAGKKITAAAMPAGGVGLLGWLSAIWLVLGGNLSVLKGQQTVTDAVIALNGTTSNLIDLGVYRPVGIVVPAAFTGTAVTFKTSYDGVTLSDLYDSSGNQVSVTVAAGRRVVLDPAKFFGVRYIEVISNANEAAARTIKVVAEA